MKLFSILLAVACFSLGGCSVVGDVWDALPSFPSDHSSHSVPTKAVSKPSSSELFPSKPPVASSSKEEASKSSSSAGQCKSLSNLFESPQVSVRDEEAKKKELKRKRIEELYKTIHNQGCSEILAHE